MQAVKQIVFVEENVTKFLETEQIDFNNVPPKHVVVKTEISTISNGTEKANLTGEKHVWGNSDYILPFPRTVGYSSAGTVVACGEGVSRVKVGDRVVVYWGKHKNYNLVLESNVVKIPDEVDFSSAAISFISIFSLAAIRKTKLEIGESCLVMGLGILGQCAVKYARLAGAYPIIAVDLNKERRDLALKSGADYAFDPTDKDFVENVKKVSNGGVKTCIEVSGVGAGLNSALDCMAQFGRVALLGCTRNKDFTVDYYRKVHSPGITLIGAHTNARPNFESYPHFFTTIDDITVALNLIKSGRLNLSDLIQEMHSPNECEEIYERLINDKDFPVCVQFDWRNL